MNLRNLYPALLLIATTLITVGCSSRRSSGTTESGSVAAAATDSITSPDLSLCFLQGPVAGSCRGHPYRLHSLLALRTDDFADLLPALRRRDAPRSRHKANL